MLHRAGTPPPHSPPGCTASCAAGSRPAQSSPAWIQPNSAAGCWLFGLHAERAALHPARCSQRHTWALWCTQACAYFAPPQLAHTHQPPPHTKHTRHTQQPTRTSLVASPVRTRSPSTLAASSSSRRISTCTCVQAQRAAVLARPTPACSAAGVARVHPAAACLSSMFQRPHPHTDTAAPAAQGASGPAPTWRTTR